MSATPGNTAQAATAPINNTQVPKHEQLRLIILKLAKEELEPGARLPSERTLMDSYGVSRITVRAAIGRLVNEGHLVRVPAKGTFVADSPVQSTLHLASFTQEMEAMGHVPSTVVLVAEQVPAPEDTAAALSLAPGAEAFHLKRLRLADGRPVSVDDAWYNPQHAPGLLGIDLTGSVYKALAAQFGHQIDRARQSVRSEGAPADIGALLGTGTGAPVLAFDRVSYSGALAIEHSRSWYRSDRYSLSMEVRL
ncbi:GntR family transcriptional regulator [Pseudarthrobacter sp. AG30]|uniref:GntR family transcriptional regulator n=1 Tax=Micrococcaceae TaxID=1268 RepID=UPI00036ACDD4|nr:MULTISPECIES: GntR family transcriptional regulator [Micrococcaceae]RAX16556.1 GntR family transcriptional regulator [Pseudarthrobacter sp. AG30]TDT79393.1 GntR family transcriptional regulator [Arthrobacter sp. AG258]